MNALFNNTDYIFCIETSFQTFYFKAFKKKFHIIMTVSLRATYKAVRYNFHFGFGD